jgi:hypothetical protein
MNSDAHEKRKNTNSLREKQQMLNTSNPRLAPKEHNNVNTLLNEKR